jgi:hypothetical protein
MSSQARSDRTPSDSVSPALTSTHEAIILLKLSLNRSGTADYEPLPNLNHRDVIPLDTRTVYPQRTSAYVICCQTHANSLSVPFFTQFTGTPNAPLPNHRPSVLLHSAHTRSHPEIEPPSNARRLAIIWLSQRLPLQFVYNDVICPCCPEHSELLMIQHRDTFSAYPDEIEEMNLPVMPTVTRTSTPELVVSPSLARPSTSNESVAASSSTETIRQQPALLTTTPISAASSTLSSQTPVSTQAPQLTTFSTQPESRPRTDPLNYLPPTGYVDWSEEDPYIGPPPPPSRSQVERHYQQRPVEAPYASVANVAPALAISAPATAQRRHPQHTPAPILSAMTQPLPEYVLDPNRDFYRQNYECIATVLRCEMLLCLHVLDYPHPSRDAVKSARSVLLTNILNQHGIRATLGNYTFTLDLFAEHLQDYHVNGIRSSSDQVKAAVTHDVHNCGILRCIFYYREGTNVDATAYLDSFNPINAFHMLLSRLNETRQPTTPKLKVTIASTHPTSKAYRLPESDFDVTLNDRDPRSLTEIPPPTRTFRNQSSVSSRGSSRSLIRRPTVSDQRR